MISSEETGFAPGPGGANSRMTLIVTSLVALAFSVYVLSLPVFPTNDGPMHLFYTAILRDLLFAKGAHYGAYYNIKHVLPPYSLYYYLLMLLSLVMSLDAANKVVICIYIFSFAFGLRYLARPVGPSGDAMALAATPLLFSWALTMGFVNFCLSTTLLFWALGVWIRNGEKPSLRRRVSFVVLAYAMMLTHPVPLLFLAGFCAIELGVRLLLMRAPGQSSATGAGVSGSHSSDLFPDIVTLLIALGTFGYVKLFTTNHPAEQQDTISEYFIRMHGNIQNIRTLRSVTPFFSEHGASHTYILLRSMLQFLLVVALVMAGVQLYRFMKRDRGELAACWTIAHTWICLAGIVVVLLPFAPSSINGSAFFAARLHIYLWLAPVVAASAYCGARRAIRLYATMFSILLTLLTLALARQSISPLASQFSEQSTMPHMERHHLGLILPSRTGPQPTEVWDPYLWGAASIFRRSNTALYNSPWLQLAIIPLGPQPTLGYCCFTTNQIGEVPSSLKVRLMASPDDGRRVLQSVDFVILVTDADTATSAAIPLLAHDTSDPTHPWTCSPYVWYAFCERSETATKTDH